MIRAENIKKSFGEQEVLKGISTIFEAGKTNLLIGRSGAGKTVFLKLLVGLLEPTSGDIWYDDTNFTQLSLKQKKAIRMQIGMLLDVFQTENKKIFDLHPYLMIYIAVLLLPSSTILRFQLIFWMYVT